MVSPKKTLAAFSSLLLAVVFSVFPPSLLAFQKQYFDWGPYYQNSQVLGFSFSSLENLPALKIPDNLMPPQASGILPDNPLYAFEKVIENTQLTFTFDPIKKEQLRLGIAAERLSEAKTLMDQGKTSAASQALDDYGKTLETLAQNLPVIAQRNDPQSQNLLNQAEEAVSRQTVAAAALSLTSSPSQAQNWTEAGNIGKQVLDKVAEGKGEPAIPESLSTGIQQLKEQGLISEEESNKLYSLKNRSEVREELNKLASSGEIPPAEITKLDTSVARQYPDVYNQEITNWQIIELRSYQTLPQPGEKIAEELQKWQDYPAVPPSNDIKPYLWYNRALDLAKEVDLSNFSPTQQSELVKSYPQAAADNPTYSPPPSPSPQPSPSPVASPADDPTAAPAASAIPSTSPSAAPVPAKPYLEDATGALPGQPAYYIKQLGEGLNLAFTFDPAQKAGLKIRQAERRLAEAEALAHDPQKASLYESTLKAYQQTVNDASTSIKQLKDPKAAKIVAEKLEAQAARHEVVFEKGLLPHPANNPKLISDIIKTAEDAMDRSADVLGRPALPKALSSRLGDLKAQGLILPEEAEELVRSSSREETRGKIRKLVDLQTFPLADAKKLDEAQSFVSPADYNQLNEVRKIEELQNLRSTQTDLAQTPTLRSTSTALAQKEAALTGSIDLALIKPEDLGNRKDLVKTYEKLASVPRPINSGQFGAEATPGAQPKITPPSPQDAVLSACPQGAVFKQDEGCVWADNGNRLNDYDQYKCAGPRQYYSFAARKCAAYEPGKGWQEDSQPICPVGYTWTWQTQSCQAFTGGGPLPLPSPSLEPAPGDEKEIEERSKSCPEGTSYQAPNGCVWDKTGKPVYDPSQYRCGRGQYYSFEQEKCTDSPKEGQPYPKDTAPACKEPDTYWNWSAGKCIPAAEPVNQPGASDISEVKPQFTTPDSSFYFLKTAGEKAQQFLAFTPQAREQTSLAQAEERLAEAIYALKKDDQAGVKKALSSYTTMMQDLVGDLSKAQLSETAKNEIGKRLAEGSAEQNLLLQKLSAWAPQAQDSAISAATSATILGVDKAADIAGQPPIPAEVKSKIEALPEKMISGEDKKKLLELDSRVDVRLNLGNLMANRALTQTDTSFLNEDFDKVDQIAKIKVEQLQKLEDIANTAENKTKLEEKIEKNEEIVRNLQEFEKTFEPGKEVPAEVRPYVRLTRINEVTQTIRPDIVRLADFQNRKDVLLAVATLQEEFKPTFETFKKVAEFRRRNPGSPLPSDLARVEALSYSLGVRTQAGPCYLPTPPFPANTPCPAPGAAIPIASYTNYTAGPGYGGGPGSTGAPATDKDGKPLVYGQGPKTVSAGVCPSGYHWMYDSNGWCMADSGNYNSSYASSYTPSGPSTPGYTPYSPYYNAPGDSSPNDGCPYNYDWDGSGNCIPNSYPASSSFSGGISYSYSPPSYYGPAPAYYTTTPPPGTVPGSGPKPISAGQCPAGYHWMSDSGGWCMADGSTYVPGGQPGPYPASPYSPNLTQSSCGPGYYWDGKGCIPTYGGSASYGNCPSGQYWNGYGCQLSSYGQPSGSSYSGSSSGPSASCSNYPSGGCTGSGAWFDWGSCSCRTGSTTSPGSYSSGYNPASGSCTQRTCGSNEWFDWGTCSCRPNGNTYTPPSGSSCVQPSTPCPNNSWFDFGTCTCRSSSSDTSSGGSTSGSSGSSSGSCPSGYHWMSDNGGWCMADGAGSSSAPTPSSSSAPAPTSAPAPSTESAPPPTSNPAPPPESAPQPPPPSEPVPAPS